MRRLILAAMTAAVLITAAPTAAEASAPKVRCMRLDKAERKVRHAGYRVVEHGGGFLGIIVKSAWVVTHQSNRGRTVHLTAGRYC